ncbi:hypothetical protein ACQPXM_27015 [Kribbella sp. CA-253562]|uniref:hypothetical protein n=1 Tax=Kribbella sp. CA-253562 TaxID=3239942 RepID=UPI003D8A53C2
MVNAAAQELLAAVGESLARSAPEEWAQVKLRITAAGGMTRTTVTATRADGTLDRKCVLDDDGEDAAVALRGAMYEADRGAWYDAYFTLDRSGELAAEFDYDSRPFDGDAEDDLMVEDQRLFPRSQELLPSWHPSRST